MPLGWFSCKEYDVYHGCLNCHHRIEPENLVIMQQMEILIQHNRLNLCKDCEIHRQFACEETDDCNRVLNTISQ